jgi:hypothetical protein
MSIRTILLGASALALAAIPAVVAFAQDKPAAPAASKPAADQAAVDPDAPTPNYKVPRTSWGDPDLRGTWPLQHLSTTVPLQRGFQRFQPDGRTVVADDKYGDRLMKTDDELGLSPAARRAGGYEAEEKQNKLNMGHWVETGTQNRRTSLIVDPVNGRLPPYTEEGLKRSQAMRSGWVPNQTFDWVTDFDNWDRCITRSLPASMLPSFYNNGVRLFQAPGYVAILTEMIHEVRIIPLDGRPAPDGKVRQWLGEPRGHWEGDTLVVVSKNFNAQGSSFNAHTTGAPPYNNVPISTQYTFTETFKRTGPDTLIYRATVDDPVIWTHPITLELPWRRDNSYELYEYACHEGNVMIPHYVSSSRAQRAADAAKAGGKAAPGQPAPQKTGGGK